jgi:protein TonB
VVISRVEPEYPRGARRVAGAIVLQGVVTRTGGVRDLRVIQGADDPMTASVLAAVRQWRFRPATRHGEPVDVIYNVTTRIHVR